MAALTPQQEQQQERNNAFQEYMNWFKANMNEEAKTNPPRQSRGCKSKHRKYKYSKSKHRKSKHKKLNIAKLNLNKENNVNYIIYFKNI